MSLLFPAMLAGLAALAVPVIIHLIARHRFPVLDFPSIRLLQRDERANVFAPRLVDKAQLLLRLLVLLALAFAMARPFLASLTARRPAHNVVVVLDCSASMTMRAPLSSLDSAGDGTLLDVAVERAR